MKKILLILTSVWLVIVLAAYIFFASKKSYDLSFVAEDIPGYSVMVNLKYSGNYIPLVVKKHIQYEVLQIFNANRTSSETAYLVKQELKSHNANPLWINLKVVTYKGDQQIASEKFCPPDQKLILYGILGISLLLLIGWGICLLKRKK